MVGRKLLRGELGAELREVVGRHRQFVRLRRAGAEGEEGALDLAGLVGFALLDAGGELRGLLVREFVVHHEE